MRGVIATVAAMSGQADGTLVALDRVVKSLDRDTDNATADLRFHMALAETLLRDSDRRRRLFGVECLGDPSWHILLDLFVQELRGTSVSTFASAMASGAPVSTGSRHLHALERAGHVIRTRDDHDARRMLVRLSAATRDAIIAHLSTFPARMLTAIAGASR